MKKSRKTRRRRGGADMDASGSMVGAAMVDAFKGGK
jgi:hypothetical protein